MVDTRAFCLTVLAAALLISGAIIYGASMVRNELHGMVIVSLELLQTPKSMLSQ